MLKKSFKEISLYINFVRFEMNFPNHYIPHNTEYSNIPAILEYPSYMYCKNIARMFECFWNILHWDFIRENLKL